ncbi:SLC13 family permease [Oscillibacter hominis]|uniref:SLC13 family permease n=1 Tax=Oscillibacter hominis TaxID=2763056 RepID=UPI001FACA46B|nr:SLC13 family permease [Oscillibacter hominis]
MEAEKCIGKRVLDWLRRDPVLAASCAAALLSTLFVPPSRAYLSYLDLRVLCLLSSLMVTVAGLKKAGAFAFLMGRILKVVHNTRTLSAALIGVCFFTSMLVTNDVALITFVPLTILMLAQRQRLMAFVIVLQTVAANLGSMLTPLGNPQNLYLYGRFNLSAGRFLSIMALPTAISLLLLCLALLWIRPEAVVAPVEAMPACPKAVLPWAGLFCVCLLAVLHVLPYGLALAVVVLAAAVLDRPILRSVDYSLLLTFAFFFLLIGNIKSIPAVSQGLSTLLNGRELTAGILLSQVISNVPAAMLLAGFTENYEPLLLGVNIGGLGTLIASMASVISYKLYAAQESARPGRYLALFTGINLLFLGVLWAAAALL